MVQPSFNNIAPSIRRKHHKRGKRDPLREEIHQTQQGANQYYFGMKAQTTLALNATTGMVHLTHQRLLRHRQPAECHPLGWTKLTCSGEETHVCGDAGYIQSALQNVTNTKEPRAAASVNRMKRPGSLDR